MIVVHAKARRREEGASPGVPLVVFEKNFVRAEARMRGDCVVGDVLPSIIPNGFDDALTRKEKACAAGAIPSSSLLLRVAAPLRAKTVSSLRVFAPSRDPIQRAAA